MRLALIGCGAIGSEIVEAVKRGVVRAELVALMDIYPERCEALKPGPDTLVTRSLDALLATNPDVVVEAASQEAVREYGPRILEEGRILVVLSVGALLDEETLRKLRDAAERGGGRVYAPTGAIAGLDAVRAARLAGIDRVVLRTRKSPRSLGVEVDRETLLYRGPAREAVRRYPFNVNVAAALALAAGVEPMVEIIADPRVDRNIHEIIVESKASKITIRVENVPSPRNPKTSYLAALSCIELLRRITSSEWLEVGS